eukprot:TRINITY_DN4005_c0_g1_i1.p1 TRINITY_DN4005_c0_g1~~TRINITY_DN4005_c0_g1_i1.p1  ORF type:complete len:336 (-),score=90.49 TRINITY_DN4005_c0_g1_i1:142-1149(-)
MCIRDRYKKECPNRCKMAQDTTIRPSSKIVQKILNKYEIRCVFCEQVFRVEHIDEHERDCRVPKCSNPLCRVVLNPSKQRRVPKNAGYACSEVCKLATMFQGELAATEKSPPLATFDKFLRAVKLESDSQGLSHLVESSSPPEVLSMANSGSAGGMHPALYGINEFVWDTETASPSVMFFAENRVALLNDAAFVYKNVFGSVGFMGGSQYWEIIIDSMTQNELKVGVSKERSKTGEGAFCDGVGGYAYYGLGELRHGENTVSVKYGKKFRKSGIIGVYLNMDQGTLSFSLNGESFGPAFKDKELEKGPIYPAVALLRVSGIILVTGKPIPAYFNS